LQGEENSPGLFLKAVCGHHWFSQEINGVARFFSHQDSEAGYSICVYTFPRVKVFAIPDLIRTKIKLLPPEIEERRLFVSERTSVFRSVTAADRVDYPALERSVQKWWEEHGVLLRYLHHLETKQGGSVMKVSWAVA
jgi:hypothetical protein